MLLASASLPSSADTQKHDRDFDRDRFTPTGQADVTDTLINRHRKGLDAIAHQLVDTRGPGGIVKEAMKKVYCVIESLEIRRHQFQASVGLYQIPDALAQDPKRPDPLSAVAKVSFTEPVNADTLAVTEKIKAAQASDAELTPEFVDRVQRGVEKLIPSHREALILINKPAQTYGDVAEILGLSVERLKVRIARARAELRRRLGAESFATSAFGVVAA
jgi:RNA polymerase sigma-70 factor (ECF subfamily)